MNLDSVSLCQGIFRISLQNQTAALPVQSIVTLQAESPPAQRKEPEEEKECQKPSMASRDQDTVPLLRSFLEVGAESRVPQETQQGQAQYHIDVKKDLQKPIDSVQCYIVACSLYQIALETLQALGEEERDLEKLDGIGGERSCQIRAVMAASFVKKEMPSLNKTLQLLEGELNGKIEAVREKIEQAPNFHDKQIPLLQCLTAKDAQNKDVFEVAVPKKVMPLMLAFLLSVAKKGLAETCIPKLSAFIHDKLPKKLQGKKVPSRPTVIAIVELAKRKLALASCEFMEEQATALKLDPFLCRMLETENRVIHDCKAHLPFYYISSAMLHIAAKMDIPVLLSVRRATSTAMDLVHDLYDTHLFYRLRSDGTHGRSALIEPRTIKDDDPLIVIDGQRSGTVGNLSIMAEAQANYHERLAQHDLFHLVECNAVAHPQCMGEKNSIAQIPLMKDHKAEQARLEALFLSASREGLVARESETCLGITHLFSSTLGREKTKKHIEV
jgi:hypothetical protein